MLAKQQAQVCKANSSLLTPTTAAVNQKMEEG
jgi:hypothetical protein